MQIAPINQNFNNVNNANPAFGKRYLQVVTKPGAFDFERIPAAIEDAIRGNKSIQDFLNEGDPKSWMEKLLSFCTRDEILEVRKCEKEAASADAVYFYFGKVGSLKCKTRMLKVDPTKLEQYTNIEQRKDKHDITSRILAEQVHDIKDFKSLFVQKQTDRMNRFKHYKEEDFKSDTYKVSRSVASMPLL